MPSSLRQLRRASLRRCRQGNTLTFALIAVAATAVVGMGGWWMFGRGGADEGPELILNEVGRGPYDFVVIEQGTVESGTNIELRCQVRSRGGGGGGEGGRGGGGGGGGGSTTIIDVVPEGTMVKEGDWVVKLDSSSLELEENSQKIQVSNRESLVTQAENTLKAARIAKEEYLKGTFVEQEKLIKSELYMAERNYATAEQGLRSAKSLLEKNIITGLQLESAHVALENSRQLLDGAKTKLATLQNLTQQRMLTDFDAQIASAEANLKSQQASLELESSKLRDIQDQIDKCTIKATADGQVVYANQYDSWRGSSSAEFVVTPGTMVRERQVIIRLPNAEDMQVKATVNEARVTLVRPGLPVTIRVDALKDEFIEGEVTKVNQYAEPGSFSSGNIKKYATFVKIKNPPPDLRVGMNAEVRIHVERHPDALQIPVQALAEVKNHFFTLVKNNDNYETREVTIGTTNDKVATIEKGLKEGDQVVMNPRGAGSLLKLPDLPDPAPTQLTEIKRTDPTETVKVVGNNSKSGGGPDGGKGGGKKGGNFSPQMLIERAMANDEDKDGKLSVAELAKIDDRGRRWLEGADKNNDGFVERIEMLTAASAFVQRMQEQGGGRGGGGGGGPGGPGGGGRRGGGEGGGPPGGGPAGGGE
jgi:RND family efflux transporter MFP subunit